MPTTTQNTQEFFYPRRADEGTIVGETMFATVVHHPNYDFFTGWDDGPDVRNDVYEIVDKTGDLRLLIEDPVELALFKELDVSVVEFTSYQDMVSAAKDLADALPAGQLHNGVHIALLAKATDYIDAVRDVRRGERSDVSLEVILQGMRELKFAYESFATVIRLHSPSVNSEYGINAWYISGGKGRNGGYHAHYEVCNDSYYNLGDQEVDGEYPPDEYHYPALVGVHINPHRRVEFTYTPTGKLTHDLHRSRTVVYGDTPKVFGNTSLSIRIDLDEKAPHGIAVDVARGPHKGDSMERDGDLLGTIFAAISEGDSHEHRGLEPGMTREFRGFSEQLALQLYLQNKEITQFTQRAKIGRSALWPILKSAA